LIERLLFYAFLHDGHLDLLRLRVDARMRGSMCSARRSRLFAAGEVAGGSTART
jgi:hypothetical protein